MTDKQVNVSESTLWPALSSVFNYLTLDPHPSSSPKTSADIPDKQDDNGYIPILPIHIDPIQFLKNQQDSIIHEKLPYLVNLHHEYLQSGDKHLSNTRKEILFSMDEIDKNIEALNEIYISEKYSKLNKYEMFIDWINKKSNINATINEIINDSDEGHTFKSLQSKSDKLSAKITKLEDELKTLKHQKKLINHQLLETKSLMDIKLNKHNDELESLSNKETLEINLMFKEKQLRSNTLSDVSVSNSLKSQINSLDTLIDTSDIMKSKYNQSLIYLSDVFDTLENLEKSIKTLIEESKTDQLEPLLFSTRKYLLERVSQVQSLELPEIKTIILNEIKAIEKAMIILNIEIPTEGDSNSNSNSLSISNDSTEYYPNINSPDNISLVSSNKQSLQINNRISISPPAPLINITTATSTKSIPTTSNSSKYDTLIKGIKISKGDKGE